VNRTNDPWIRRGAATALTALLITAFAAPLAATLGKPRGDVAQVQKTLGMAESVETAGQGYRFVTLSSPDLKIKEFVNPATGIVFGVSWRGARPPDVKLLLGVDPSNIQGPGVYRSLRVVHIETSTLFLEYGGFGKSYAGRGVRLDLLPAGVAASEVTLP
jgi:hypothetical protein